jgi:Rod binding domain-containing protein
MVATPSPTSAIGTLSRYSATATAQTIKSAYGGAQKAKAASEDFEAVFLSSMFNEMFASVKGEGPMGDTGGTGIWRSFLSDEYAKSFAKSGGIGLGAQVYQSLLAQQEIKNP